MLYRCLTLVAILTFTACASTVDATEPTGDVPAYDDEPTPTPATDAPAPLYAEQTDVAPPTPAPADERHFTPRTSPAPAPAPMPADATPAPAADPTPAPAPDVTPAPAAPTSCLVTDATGHEIALTCENVQRVYPYVSLAWKVDGNYVGCRVPASDVAQCTPGAKCFANHTDANGRLDGTVVSGVCQ
jgi:hypothetical protein